VRRGIRIELMSRRVPGSTETGLDPETLWCLTPRAVLIELVVSVCALAAIISAMTSSAHTATTTAMVTFWRRERVAGDSSCGRMAAIYVRSAAPGWR